MPSMTVLSAAMRRLRREASRMRGSLAPAGGVAKKPSPPPLCSPPTSPPAPPANRAGGDTHAAAPAEPMSDNKSSSISVCLGTKVRVRTPVRVLRPGRHLVFWLHAVVVDALEEEDGHIEVIYCDYEHPDSDPLGVVRVLKKDVKNMVQRPAAAIDTAGSGTCSSDVTTSYSDCTSQGAAAPVRPTVAGKKPSLLKKMEEEMRSESEDILDFW